MKQTLSILVFSPFVVSIISVLLAVLNEAFPVLPAWVLWQMAIISTVAAGLFVGLIIAVWLVQRLNQIFSQGQRGGFIKQG